MQSSVYGSDGLGGVVHIRTRSSDSDGGSLNVSRVTRFFPILLALSQSLGESNRLRLSLSDDEGTGCEASETQAASIVYRGLPTQLMLRSGDFLHRPTVEAFRTIVAVRYGEPRLNRNIANCLAFRQ